MAEDDRYTIPGSGGVLRNKLGLITQAGVDRAMNISASAEWAILQLEPIPDRLDLDYLRSIHRRFMSPVLDWAGELRKVGDEVGAGGTPFQYAPSEFYKPYLDALFDRLVEEDYLVGLPEKEFADRLADRWGTLTFCHPFRDGNTRSQSAYIDRLATRVGHPIDWQHVNVSELREARLSAAFRVGGEQVLSNYLQMRLLPPSRSATLRFAPE
ncbi:Fic/DOC family protein [Actinomyces glycerinitolerans]|uniref:Fic/DOC family protein n=1 Tax=Actinomyces glycerinitolerans TaxID=1892869 RepID=UPI0009FAC71D|nr:Fic family protein [Actinomyces glycerinitolerans]